MGKGKGETYAELRAHIAKWRKKKGKGFNANPFGEIEEMIRWLSSRIDRTERHDPSKVRR